MPRLPRISGKDAIRALKQAGFTVFDQTGSHVYLHRFDGSRYGPRVTVPIHGNKTLAPKTLKCILDSAGVSIQNFTDLL
jgi:predicted RNA binding protein YcfA (HicA-like mRNA interferase family)